MVRCILALAAALAALASPAFAAVYGPWAWTDPNGTPINSTDAFGNPVHTLPPLSGAYAITDQATYQGNIAVLAPYAAVGPLPAQSVLAGDDPAAPRATVILHFPDFATAQTVMTQVNGLVSAPPANETAEVAMFRVKIVMQATPSTHGGTLYDRVPLFIASLSPAQQIVANQLWAGAPNLDPISSFAQGFKAWEGVSDTAWNALIAQARGLAF